MSLFVSLLYPQSCNDETGWCYDQSTLQSFYLYQEIHIDGVLVEPGQGTQVGPGDVVGAFKDGVCVGWVYADAPGIGYSPSGFTTLPLMGNDGTYFGLSTGEAPDEVLIYDTSSDTILPLNPNGAGQDTDGDYVPDSEWSEYPGFANNELFYFPKAKKRGVTLVLVPLIKICFTFW